MNDHDRDNLNFLLSIDGKALEEWQSVVSQDDLDYAMELLAMYSQELKDRSDALLIEALMVHSDLDPYPEANAVIQRIMQM